MRWPVRRISPSGLVDQEVHKVHERSSSLGCIIGFYAIGVRECPESEVRYKTRSHAERGNELRDRGDAREFAPITSNPLPPLGCGWDANLLARDQVLPGFDPGGVAGLVGVVAEPVAAAGDRLQGLDR